MNTLFPEMDNEIRDDRKAARREKEQRARRRLSESDLSWLVNYLLENGPQTEHEIALEAVESEDKIEDASKRCMSVLVDLYSLWVVRKLWRVKVGIHPGSGEESYRYGIRGVHRKP